MLLIQFQRQIIGNLTTRADDNAMRILQFEDIHHALKGKLVEIQAIAHIIVSRYRLRVIIDHYRAESVFSNGIERLYAAPVKLYRRADAVCTRTQYNDRAFITLIINISAHAGIRKIQIVRKRRILSSKRINLLHNRKHTEPFAVLAHLQYGLICIHTLSHQASSTSNLEIREALTLGLTHQVSIHIIESAYTR